MSITKNLGRSATFSKPSDSRPLGFGVWKVPSASQRSSQASSIRCASAGVYRYGGTSPGSAPCWLTVWLIFSRSWSRCSAWAGRKKPLAQEGSPCCPFRSGQHGRRRRSPDTPPDYRAPFGAQPKTQGHGRLTPSGEGVTLSGAARPPPADDGDVVSNQRLLRRALLWGTLACIVLFATGIPARPAGAGWDRFYDVVLYNLAYLPAAGACWLASGRVRSERLARRGPPGAPALQP